MFTFLLIALKHAVAIEGFGMHRHGFETLLSALFVIVGPLTELAPRVALVVTLFKHESQLDILFAEAIDFASLLVFGNTTLYFLFLIFTIGLLTLL